MQTLTIYKVGFNQNYCTFTLILPINIVMWSKFPWTKFINCKRFEMRSSGYGEAQRPRDWMTQSRGSIGKLPKKKVDKPTVFPTVGRRALTEILGIGALRPTAGKTVVWLAAFRVVSELGWIMRTWYGRDGRHELHLKSLAEISYRNPYNLET